jgi:predicted MFS family arabinose efflux permease
LALLNGLAIAQTFTRGALTVFTVVVALDLLRIGEPGVGTLTAAVGAGAVIGFLIASLLVGSRRLARWFGIGVALWGLPIALIPLFPGEATALILLACVGFGNALVDVGLFTLMARLAPDAVLARLFGLQESLVSLTLARCRRCVTLDQSYKPVRGNGRRRGALSDPGGGDMASPGAS